MKTEPQPRQHHEGEPPPESLIHHEEPTLLEQWFRKNLERGWSFWATVGLGVAAAVAVGLIIRNVSGPSRAAIQAWTEMAEVAAVPSSMNPFGPDPNAELPEKLLMIAEDFPETPAGRWAKLRAASLLLSEGSVELATLRRSAGAGKIVEAETYFDELVDAPGDEALRRMAALGQARAAEARLGLDADDTDRADLDEVLDLYDRVIEQFPDTPEAEQAFALKRRLQRPESLAFYEELARYDPDASIPGAPSMDLAPGQTSPLPGLPDALGTGSGFPGGGLIPGLGGGSGTGLPSMPGIDLSPPADATDADMPAPVPLPEVTPAEPSPEAEAPDEPAPAPSGSESGSGSEPEAPTPAPAPADDSPRVPDDPFGSAPGTPTPTAEPAPEPQPEPAPEPSGGGELPESVFPSGGPNG